ncbi:MAG: hypothetical protein H0V34_02690 [Gammaproteobacteria bacterium]|nr:hypothetical protein [Gammaproteobacteria bacterium]
MLKAGARRRPKKSAQSSFQLRARPGLAVESEEKIIAVRSAGDTREQAGLVVQQQAPLAVSR